jgi:hypothetical protein
MPMASSELQDCKYEQSETSCIAQLLQPRPTQHS